MAVWTLLGKQNRVRSDTGTSQVTNRLTNSTTIMNPFGKVHDTHVHPDWLLSWRSLYWTSSWWLTTVALPPLQHGSINIPLANLVIFDIEHVEFHNARISLGNRPQ